MKLYGSLTSPYARKVRAVLLEKNLTFEFVNEGPNDAAGNVARLNPLGKVPVLVRDDGEVLFDSPMIVEYLDALTVETLIPEAGDLRWRAQRWHALGQGICDAVVTRLMETRRQTDKQDPAVLARQEGKVTAALIFADENIGDDSYLVADQFGIADIAMAVALEYIDFRFPHEWRQRHPALARWLAGIGERRCLLETRPPA